MKRTYFAARIPVLIVAMLGAGVLGTGGARGADYVANFDSILNEGTVGVPFTDVGVTFWKYVNDLGPNPSFVIERANQADLGAAFTAPNTLGFGGYSPGPSEGFARMSSMEFSIPVLAQHVQLDVFDFPVHSGNTLTLTGFLNHNPVQSASFLQVRTTAIQHGFLELNNGPFDYFTLTSAGPVDNGYGFLIIDNVRVTPVPEPSTLGLLAAGGLTAMQRRRARKRTA